MADLGTIVSKVTTITTGWFQDVNNAVYRWGTTANTIDTAQHAAPSKTTPVDADELKIADSASGFSFARLTFANLRAQLFSLFGAQLNAATSKTTPTGADSFAIQDSAAANTTKQLTVTNLISYIQGLVLTFTQAITFNGGITTTSLNSNQIGGYRNKIINSGFAVSQVNGSTAVTVTAGAALNYVIDQFYAYCTGANVTGQRVAGTTQDQYMYQFTGAASVTAIGFAQRMESLRVYSLNGLNATLSVELANSLLTSVTWTAYYANSTDTFGTLGAPTRTQIATGTFTVSSSLATYTTTIAIPSAAITGIEVVLTVGAQTSGTWTIGKMQLEQGSTATTFEKVYYDDQLRWCQRYLPVFNSTGTLSYISPAFTNTTTSAWGTINFKVPTRVPVTGAVVSNAGHFTFLSAASFAASGAALAYASNVGASLNLTIAGGSASQGGEIYFNNASGQLYFTGAQL